MPRCIPLALALILVGMSVAVCAAEKTELEGTWELVSLERAGKPVPVKSTGRLVFTGGTFVVEADGKKTAAGTFQLDPGKNPKTIDTTYTEGKNTGQSFKGIYRIDGDTLTTCRASAADKERPVEFKTSAENGELLSTNKRVKP